jgi:hypothetical protein
MDNNKIVSALLISIFIFSLVLTAPVFATTTNDKGQQVFSYLAAENDKPQNKPGKPSTSATVTLQNIPSGDYLLGTVTIIATASGSSVKNVYYSVNSGPNVLMASIDSTGRYQASWTTTDFIGQNPTLTVKATDTDGNVLAATSPVTVNVVGDPKYELKYEVDCIGTYLPSAGVFSYIEGYWLQHAIKVTFAVDDTGIPDPNNDGVISNSEFWAIENQYNDGSTNSSKYGYQYTLSDKWMLYGSWDTNSGVGGYTYMTRAGTGGNYIFIADGMIQDWQSRNSISSPGGEIIVAGHEAGHSIGILVGGGEKYDPDYYSIMALMRTQNAKAIAPNWYYSQTYWATANLNYYPYTPPAP